MTAVGREDRPLGISLLIWLFWFWAGAVVLLVLGLAIGEGPVLMSGRTLDRGEALVAVLPALFPMGLAVVAAAVALTARWKWARPAALFPFVLAVFGPALIDGGGVTSLDVVLALAVLGPILVGLVWYLYFRPGPASYLGAGGAGASSGGTGG
jgi:hypothetical protein